MKIIHEGKRNYKRGQLGAEINAGIDRRESQQIKTDLYYALLQAFADFVDTPYNDNGIYQCDGIDYDDVVDVTEAFLRAVKTDYESIPRI